MINNSFSMRKNGWTETRKGIELGKVDKLRKAKEICEMLVYTTKVHGQLNSESW